MKTASCRAADIFYKPVRLLLSAFFVCLTVSGDLPAQIVYMDNGHRDAPETIALLCNKALEIADSLTKEGYDARRLDIYNWNTETLLFFTGRLDVLRWDGKRWMNLVKNPYSGYNFSSRKIFCGNQLYSYGGLGFWKHHGHIIQFNPTADYAWDMLEETRHFPFANSFTDGCRLHILSDSVIVFDVERRLVLSKRPNPYAFIMKEFDHFVLETEDFLVFPIQKLLIEKDKMKMLRSAESPLYVLGQASGQNRSVIHIHANKIHMSRDNIVKMDTLDLRYLLSTFTPVPLDRTPSQIDRTVLLYSGFILALITLMYLVVRRKTNVRETHMAGHDPDELVKRIHSLRGKTLSVEQLDELLYLTSLPQDTQRYKRFQYIREINDRFRSSTGYPLIERERDPSDGRRCIYIIRT